MLATAQEEAERLSRFVDNLLDMTRLEAGALGPKREPVDVADAVGSALRRTSRLLAGHRVVTDLPADLPLVRGDFVLLEQVLVNLLENAARYATEGTTVEIAGRAGGEAFVLEIRDRGPGIPAEDAGRVFDPFYRAPTRRRARAWDWGSPSPRASSRRWAAPSRRWSAPGGGAVFRLSFPAELVTAAAGEEPAACLLARPRCWWSTTSRRSSASSRARSRFRAGPRSRPRMPARRSARSATTGPS